MSLHSRRRFRFDVEPDCLWRALERVDRFPTWWPWLRDFDGTVLKPGETWRCRVQPPVPYSVRLTLHILAVDPGRSVDATVEGDLEGWARLRVEGGASASELVLESELSARSRSLQTVMSVARPVALFGHGWVLDTGARQFAQVALGGSGDGAKMKS